MDHVTAQIDGEWNLAIIAVRLQILEEQVRQKGMCHLRYLGTTTHYGKLGVVLITRRKKKRRGGGGHQFVF